MAESKSTDLPSRVKRSTPFGTACFVGLRAADIFLQYYLTKQGGAARVISLLGLPTVAIANTAYSDILVGLAAMGSIKHIYWVLDISEAEMPTGQAFQIAIANSIFASVNAFLASLAWSSLASSSELLQPDASVVQELSRSPILAAAVAINVLGILIETVSELQRKSFKANTKNKGKPYAGGLFSLARHVNYGGYAMWRAANALAAGGIASAIPVFAFFTYNFISSSIPALEKVSLPRELSDVLLTHTSQYCDERYGDSCKEIKNNVKWKLFPGIY
jgi:hypothetical protein